MVMMMMMMMMMMMNTKYEITVQLLRHWQGAYTHKTDDNP
jgi:hypothetical protein